LRDPAPVSRLVLVNTTRLALPIILASLSAACAAPGSVEGVFSDAEFRLECEKPLSKATASGRDKIVVLAEFDTETLRTVSIGLPHFAELPVGEELAVGSGAPDDQRPSVDVVVGALHVDTRSDGVEVLSPSDPVRAASLAGSLTLDEKDDELVAGSFQVDLDDGGFLEGTFVVTAD
jgi:hypothetical protein